MSPRLAHEARRAMIVTAIVTAIARDD